MISDRAKELLSEGISENGEQTVIFLEEEAESVVFRLFWASGHAGDPERRAIRWLGRARGLCRTVRGELRTGLIRSRDEENVMATLSGSEIEAKEWLQRTADICQLSAGQAAR